MTRLDPAAAPELLFGGCWRITLPDPFVPAVTSVFLLRGADGDWLLDAGADTAESLDALESKLADLGTGTGDLRGVILSHSHLDHAGGLLRWSPERLVAHADAAAEMRNLEPRSSRGPSALRLMGVPDGEIGALAPGGEPIHGSPLAGVTVTSEVQGRRGLLTELDGWEWRLAEGHAPGHVMLYRPAEGAFLVADQFLERWKTPLLVSDPHFDSFGAYLASAREALADRPDVLYSSHTAELRPAAAWLTERIERLEAQAGRTLEAVRDGASTAYEAMLVGYNRVPDGGLRVLFLREQLATLRHLAARGDVKREWSDVERFEPA